MEDKLFLMTENSFKSTITYFNNKEEIDNTNKEKLLFILTKFSILYFLINLTLY